MELSELVRCPVKVQRCAGRVVQTELVVQIDQRDVVSGDIIIFEPGDLFPGDVRLLSSKHLVVRYSTCKVCCLINGTCEFFMSFFLSVQPILDSMITPCFLNSQASLTGESWTTEKTADIREDQSTPLLDLRNICFMVS